MIKHPCLRDTVRHCLKPEVGIAATKPEITIFWVAWQIYASTEISAMFHVFEDGLFGAAQWRQILVFAMPPSTGSSKTATAKPEVDISH